MNNNKIIILQSAMKLYICKKDLKKLYYEINNNNDNYTVQFIEQEMDNINNKIIMLITDIGDIIIDEYDELFKLYNNLKYEILNFWKE